MLRLILFRHAEAVALAAGGDVERSLTDAGIAAATRMGAHLRQMHLVPDLVLVSSARRTRETFAAAEAGLKQKLKARFEPALYNAAASSVLALLAQTPPQAKIVAVIGHNPSLAECAVALAGTGTSIDLSRLYRHFPAPCLAILDFSLDQWDQVQPASGRLEHFITLASLDQAEQG